MTAQHSLAALLEELRPLSEAATPGPWYAAQRQIGGDDHGVWWKDEKGYPLPVAYTGSPDEMWSEEGATFIAAAVNFVRALLASPEPVMREVPGEPHAYGIIDPDYARVFSVARCIAWSEGYALVMHGSFTRDLDLVALPWEESATEPEHLVKRITLALDDLSLLVKKPGEPSQATVKPHGRLAWTFTFKTFGDPRFVDLSVMPRVLLRPDGAAPTFATINNRLSDSAVRCPDGADAGVAEREASHG